MKIIVALFKKTLLPLLDYFPVLRRLLRLTYFHLSFWNWKLHGSPVPPPHAIKEFVLWDYARKYNLGILVETGTFYGEMINGVKDFFTAIYSIELSSELHELAVKRFDGDAHIHLLFGHSGEKIGSIVSSLTLPALFWLDAHYSAGNTARGEKDTPIYEELRTILGGTGIQHCIVIDDARCFGSDPGYPSLDELRTFVNALQPGLNFLVEGDSIRIFPQKAA